MMDYTKEVVKFHTERIAFLVINDDILFLKHNSMGHEEWFNTLGLNVPFDEIVRGYVLNDKMVFYKGDFVVDDMVMDIANRFYDIIREKLELENPELRVGVEKNSNINPWPLVRRLK